MYNRQSINVDGASNAKYAEVHKFPGPFSHDLCAVFQLVDVQKPYSTEYLAPCGSGRVVTCVLDYY
jgi:hypothetical protein